MTSPDAPLPPPPTPPSPPPPPHAPPRPLLRQEAEALTKRPNLASAFMRAERPAHWAGAIAGTAVVGVLTAASQLSGSPYLALLALLGLVIAVGIAFGVALLVYPRDLWRAMEAFAYQGRAEVDDFVRLNGRPVPKDPLSAREFLDQSPTRETLLQHAEVAAAYGWISVARDRAAAFRPETAYEEVLLLSLLAFVDYCDGRRPDPGPLREAVGRVQGPDKPRARVLGALSESRFAVGNGDRGWYMPLAEARDGLPREATRIARRDQWPRLLVSAGLVPVLAWAALVLLGVVTVPA